MSIIGSIYSPSCRRRYVMLLTITKKSPPHEMASSDWPYSWKRTFHDSGPRRNQKRTTVVPRTRLLPRGREIGMGPSWTKQRRRLRSQTKTRVRPLSRRRLNDNPTSPQKSENAVARKTFVLSVGRPVTYPQFVDLDLLPPCQLRGRSQKTRGLHSFGSGYAGRNNHRS